MEEINRIRLPHTVHVILQYVKYLSYSCLELNDLPLKLLSVSPDIGKILFRNSIFEDITTEVTVTIISPS